MTTAYQIQTLALPTAGGVDFEEGDVRHFSQDDALNADNVARATQNLAQRDNYLAEKVNELVTQVNNQDQIVPLPLMVINVLPSTQELIGNFRIPPGFEARVFDVTIASNPVNTVRVDVLYNSIFGSSTGTTVASALTTEWTAGSIYYPSGEFIVMLTNVGSVSAEARASVLVTMRPTGFTQGLLAGTGTVTQLVPGPPGPTGPSTPGPAGASGPAGLMWKGVWSGTTPYTSSSGVSYAFNGSSVASYIALIDNIGIAPPNPAVAPSAQWGLLAYAPANVGSSAASPSFIRNVIAGTLSTSSAYTAGVTNGPYVSFGTSSQANSAPLSFSEYVIVGTNAPSAFSELGLLKCNQQVPFAGTLNVSLPQQFNGATFNWATPDCNFLATSNGTLPDGLSVVMATVPGTGATTYTLIVSGLNPQDIAFTITGMKMQ